MARNRRRLADRPSTVPVEVLENKQLLSGTNSVEVDGRFDGPDVDPEIADFREQLFTRLLQQADSTYGELYGTTIPPNSVWARFLDYGETGVDIVQAFTADVLSDLGGTNVQVSGVDEADMVETDGRHLFSVRERELIIASVETDEAPAQIVARVELEFPAQSIYLHDGRLTVIGQTYANRYPVSVAPVVDTALGFRADSAIFIADNTTHITTFDVTDATSPVVESQFTVDGSIRDSRMVDGKLIAALESTPRSRVPYLGVVELETADPGPESTSTETARKESFSSFVSSVTDLVEDIDVNLWVDGLIDRVGDITPESPTQRYQTREEFIATLHDLVASQSPAAIHRVNDDGSTVTVELLETGDDPSQGYGYLSGNLSIAEFDLSAEVPEFLDNVPLLSDSGWFQYLHVTPESTYAAFNGSDGTHTVLQKVTRTDEGLQVSASGTVPGRLDSQFSLDEHNGFLRVATTSNSDSGQTVNNLYVLEDTGDSLEVVGSVEGLAETERIFAMRFVGDRAWMVTYRQIDPVFAFDLSDPTNPQMVGELKIPGFSDYLQPIGDDLLLAVGKGGESDQQLQVSLFDVSDLANPIRLDDYLFDGVSRSSALYDHHAFQYIAEYSTLAIPFSTYERSLGHQYGLSMISVDREQGLDLVSTVDNVGRVSRSVPVGDKLHVIAPNFISVIDLDEPTEVLRSLTLSGEPPVVTTPVLGVADSILRWTRSFFSNPSIGSQVLNPIDRYEVWVTDAETREVALHTEIEDTELNLEELGGGRRLWVWLRGVLEDGTKLDWSSGSTVHTLQPLLDLIDLPERTGRRNPILEWDTIPGAESVEVEVTDPEGNVTLLTGEEVVANRMQLADELAPGTYSIRLRLILGESETTDWTPSHEITIVGTPELDLSEGRLELIQPQAASAAEDVFEVWVNRRSTGEQVFHADDWNVTTIEDAIDAFGLNEHAPDDYAVWVRQLLPDGSVTDWSEGEILQTLIEAVPIDGFSVDDLQELVWNAATGVESYEVFVRQVGEIEPLFHSTDLLTSSLQFTEGLSPGTYEWWVRGQREDGSITRWGERQRFEVAEVLAPIFQDGQLNWTAASDTTAEVWINRLNDAGQLIQSRTLHQTDLEGGSLDLSDLNDGHYRAWMRTIRRSAAGEEISQWVRSDFEKATDFSDLFADRSQDLLGELNV